MTNKKNLDVLEKEWRGGVLLNPFGVINKAVKKENPLTRLKRKNVHQYALLICEEVAELFLGCTDYLASHQDESIKKIENNFLAAMFLYLHEEAPSDEQSLCMVCDLVMADNPSDNENHPSDLDRLFKLLEEKNDEHLALVQYRKYQNSGFARKSALRSLKRRFRPLISITASGEGNIFDECSKFELLELAASLVHNCGDSPKEPQAIYEMMDEIIFVTATLAFMILRLHVPEQTSNRLFEILRNPEVYAPKITSALKDASSDAFPELHDEFSFWHESSEKIITAGNFNKATLNAIEKFFVEYK